MSQRNEINPIMANTATNTTDAVNKTSVNVSVLAKKDTIFIFLRPLKYGF